MHTSEKLRFGPGFWVGMGQILEVRGDVNA